MTDTELEDLVRRFIERTLPKAEWTHAAHLAVGSWHVCRYGRDDAFARLRFYSRERLESVQARLGWAEPDRAPLA